MDEPHVDYTCSICLDTLDEHYSTYIANLPCKHSFHTKCVVEYFVKNNTSSCPLCRNELCDIDRQSTGLPHVIVQVADDLTTSSEIIDRRNVIERNRERKSAGCMMLLCAAGAILLMCRFTFVVDP